MNPDLIARLTKACGMLGSDFDGERASAAHAATRMLRRHGLTWAELIQCALSAQRASEPPKDEPPPRQGPPRDHHCHGYRYRRSEPAHFARGRTALECGPRVITPWEHEFLTSILQRWSPFTERQGAALARIEKRIRNVKAGEAAA